MYGICQLTLIPLRKEPSERSEMVSQLLFGETFDLLVQKEGWSHIVTHFDGYKGWMTSKMATLIDEHQLKEYNSQKQVIVNTPFLTITPDPPENQVLLLAAGSELCIDIPQNKDLPWYTFSKCTPLTQPTKTNRHITANALTFINAPYLWGGRTIFGMDCSGFTQLIYKISGHTLPRDASEQALQGSGILSVEQAQPGDLAFFENPEGMIIHAGIILEDSNIIHASGKVRVDKIDNQGIYNTQDQKYTHKLKTIQRIH